MCLTRRSAEMFWFRREFHDSLFSGLDLPCVGLNAAKMTGISADQLCIADAWAAANYLCAQPGA